MRRTAYQVKPADVPPETRAALAARARSQTVHRYGLEPSLFDEAEEYVQHSLVLLTGHNEGKVYDARNGRWKAVGLRYCDHCPHAKPDTVCEHKIAVAFADLLARYAPAPVIASDLSHSGGREHSNPQTPGAAGLGGGRYTAAANWRGCSRRRSLRKRNGGHDHCPRCGAFLTATGGCNKCGGA